MLYPCGATVGRDRPKLTRVKRCSLCDGTGRRNYVTSGREITPPPFDIAILGALDELGGLNTGYIARAVDPWGYDYSARISSGGVRTSLTQMQRDRLVTNLDGQKPVYWVGTPKGTTAYEVANG